ncbi:DNA repair protein RecO [Fredinandcohnia quinoae]|uniref:DNA repair protein RecO n=1 Tax=Fredinandcohnia quinoae TaxID=2918902 RepID=A0AAW5E5S8_9BACI|nr:DNA repair protein RecO [Fredinandcohnia sp. SECRCQ15]MCH1624970.1 DNA repair protein RecO [Fredinandcohnia sp. SECRCQ15]
MLQKCEGIVIRTNDYGETNKIVTLFTREWGKVGVMARGAKKPSSRLTAITQLFTYGYYLIQKSSGLGGLQQGETISSFRGIREDIFMTAYASYIVELTDKCTEEKRANPFLFELLYQTLNYMNEGYDLDVLMYIYELKMLPMLGLYPILDECAVCHSKEGEFAFSVREGGLLCHRCYGKDRYHFKTSQATIRLLRLFYYFDLNRLGNIDLKEETKKELKTVINAYYEEYSGLYLKSKRFLDQIENLRNTL